MYNTASHMPQNTQVEKKEEKKISKLAIFIMSCFALGLGYIVLKEVSLPPGVLAVAAIGGGITILVLGVRRPEVITYVLVAYLPFSKVLAGDFGGMAMALNLTNLLMLLIMMAWVTGKYADGESLWVHTPLNFSIIAFSLLGLLSVIRGNYYDAEYAWFALIDYKRWVTPIMMFFLVLNTVKDRATIRNVVIVIMVVTTVVGLMAIYDYINVGDASLESSRIGGIATHSNTLAAFFNYYIFLPFGFLLMNMSRPKYWLLMIPFLIMFRGIMVTFSRGGYVAFAFGLYAITFFRSKMLLLLLLAVTIFSVANPILLPAGIRYRMGQTFTEDTRAVSFSDSGEEQNLDASAASRIEIWTGAIQMIKEHPMFGIGYGLFFWTIPDYWDGGNIDAHNTYLITAAEMGIPALLFLLLIILIAMWNTYILYKTTKDDFAKALALGYLGGLFGLLMANMFGSRLESQEVASYFWILNAIIMRLRIIDRRELENGGTKKGLVPSESFPKSRKTIRDY